jgi:DNA primase
VNFGVENLPAGPGVYTADGVYIVEGRADVVLFLRAGIENVVAVEGTSIPQAVIDLSRKKRIIAVLDGDRGGDLIEKELAQVMKVEKVIRAPDGKEVEDLTPIEVHQMLRGELPGRNPREARQERSERYERRERPERSERFERRERPERAPRYERYERAPRAEEGPAGPATPPVPAPVVEKVKEVFPSINGTLEAMLLDEGLNEKGRLPISELVAKMDNAGASYIVFDGIVTQRLIDAAGKASVKGIIGHRIGEIKNMPEGLSVGTFRDLQLE